MTSRYFIDDIHARQASFNRRQAEHRQQLAVSERQRERERLAAERQRLEDAEQQEREQTAAEANAFEDAIRSRYLEIPGSTPADWQRDKADVLKRVREEFAAAGVAASVPVGDRVAQEAEALLRSPSYQRF